MKPFYLVSLFCLASFATLGADTNVSRWGPVTSHCQISIQISEGDTQIKTNQCLNLAVQVRNLSTNESLTLDKWVGAEIYFLDPQTPVFTQSSSDPFYYELKDGSFGGSVALAEVPPQGLYKFKFNAGPLKKYGTNSICKLLLKRRILNGKTVVSNPLFLQVSNQGK